MCGNNLLINFYISKKTLVSFINSPGINLLSNCIYTYNFNEEKNKKINAAILIIGNEILSGRTQEKNIAFISNWLNSECGIAVSGSELFQIIEDYCKKHLRSFKKFQLCFYYRRHRPNS